MSDPINNRELDLDKMWDAVPKLPGSIGPMRFTIIRPTMVLSRHGTSELKALGDWEYFPFAKAGDAWIRRVH